MSSSHSAEREQTVTGPPPDLRVRVALLGSTGSIGRQALDVLRRDPRFEVVGLSAGRNVGLFAEQIRAVRPSIAILAEDADRSGLGSVPDGTAVDHGDGAIIALATRPDIDLLIVGTGGIVSLRPVIAALEAGTPVATANKETLVAGGHLVMPLARTLALKRLAEDPSDPLASPLAWVRPIDSEHSAIWQCLAGERPDSIARLILTASGGPFLDMDAQQLEHVTATQALRHPTWSMGAKISVDSATLVNKGLEVIEAYWLYDVRYDMIDVVIHPQSVVHSAVRFIDGSVKAQLGTPDMRLPIQYALTYPLRRPSPAEAPDLVSIGSLDFRAPDMTRFPGLRIAREAGLEGPWATAALIAADDVAVTRFLAGSLDFMGIPRLLEQAISRFGTRPGPAPDVDELVAVDQDIRDRYGSGAIA